MNPFGTKIEMLFPLKIRYNPSDMLSLLSTLPESNPDYSQFLFNPPRNAHSNSTFISPILTSAITVNPLSIIHYIQSPSPTYLVPYLTSTLTNQTCFHTLNNSHLNTLFSTIISVKYTNLLTNLTCIEQTNIIISRLESILVEEIIKRKNIKLSEAVQFRMFELNKLHKDDIHTNITILGNVSCVQGVEDQCTTVLRYLEDKEKISWKEVRFLWNMGRIGYQKERVDEIMKVIFEGFVKESELEILNREHIHSGGFMDDILGNDFDIKSSASNIFQQAKEVDVSSESIFSMIKSQASNLKSLSDSTSDLYKSTKEKLSQPKPKSALIDQSQLFTYTYLLLLSDYSKLSNNLLIFVCKNWTSNDVNKHPKVFQDMILGLHKQGILHKRIKEIQQSPYEILEKLTIPNWQKGIFDDEFRHIYRQEIYQE